MIEGVERRTVPFFCVFIILVILALTAGASSSSQIAAAEPSGSTKVSGPVVASITSGASDLKGQLAINPVTNFNGRPPAFPRDSRQVEDLETGATFRVSVASDGSQANSKSWHSSASADGRFVAFTSWSSNLVAGDWNSSGDIFVHDLQTGQTELVSVASDGSQGNNLSWLSRISGDGRYVAFESAATNLVVGDTNETWDIFVHDRVTGITERVSVSSDGQEANTSTGYIRPRLSYDGRYVAFSSNASNLVPYDTNEAPDVFVHDRETGTTERVSVSSYGSQGNHSSGSPSISADGRYVAFQSSSDNLVDGHALGFRSDIYVHDRETGQTEQVSVASDGTAGNWSSGGPDISADGRFVVFDSVATNLVPEDTYECYDYSRDAMGLCRHIYVHDRETGQTERVSVSSDNYLADGVSAQANISGDGRYAAFESDASNLVVEDTNECQDTRGNLYPDGHCPDIFVHDRETGQTERVSVSSNGEQANGVSGEPSISADGGMIAFYSYADNLVVGDTNQERDVFAHNRVVTTTTYSISGRVIGQDDNPISDVTLSTSAGHTATTDSDGNYEITGVPAGTYTITPTLAGFAFSPLSDTATVPPAAKGKNFTGSLATTVDLSVDEVVIVQAVESQPLVKDKSAAIKVIVRKMGSLPVDDVAVRVVFDTYTSEQFYVLEDANLDDETHVLQKNNTEYPLSFSSEEITKTVYFFGEGLTPTKSSYMARATVNPDNTVAEINETNNTQFSGNYSVYVTSWGGRVGEALSPQLYVHYFPTDWGGQPMTAFNNTRSFSDAFIQGTFPVASQDYKSDISDFYKGDTRLYRLGGELTEDQIKLWIRYNLPLLRAAHLTADRFVALVPVGWFAQNTELKESHGIAYPNRPGLVIAEAAVPTIPNGQSFVTHELGHSYGLNPRWEEYDSNHDGKWDRIGVEVEPGLWADRKIPMLQSETRDIYAFMGGSQDMNTEFWVKTKDYLHLMNQHASPVAPDATPARGSVVSETVVLATGTVDISGTVSLEDDWYLLPGGHVDLLPSGPYTFEYEDNTGEVLHQIPFDIIFKGNSQTEAGFVFTLPYVPGVERVVVRHEGAIAAVKEVSSNPPSVSIASPNGGEQQDDVVSVQWSGSDLDGDSLTYMLLFSNDNGATWEPIDGNITATSYDWDVSELPAGTDYLVKVIATDGFNTAEDVSDASFTITRQVLLPLIAR